MGRGDIKYPNRTFRVRRKLVFDVSKKNCRHRLAEAMSRFTELPVEAMCNIPLFCLKGREEVEITGCRGILHYEEERVVVKTCGGPFTVTGKRLILSDFHRDVLLVRGVIDGVRFDTEDRAGEARGEC